MPYQLRPLSEVLTTMAKRFKGKDYGEIKMLLTNFVVDRKGVFRSDPGEFTADSMRSQSAITSRKRE